VRSGARPGGALAWIVRVAALLIIVEALSAVTLNVLEARRRIAYTPVVDTALSPKHRRALEDLLAGKTSYVIHSPALGWTIKPSGSAPLYRANGQGIRASREYDLRPPAQRVRIAAFGDSFTHGDDVANADTWEEALGRLSGRLEVLNFGVGGFGLDQAYLRYRQDGARFEPRIVLIGFMSEDILRGVSVFRPYYIGGTGLPLSKPRYALEGGRLTLIANPLRDLSHYRELLDAPAQVLPRLGAHDYYYQTRYRPGPLDLLASVRLFKLTRFDILDPFHGIITRNGYYIRESEAFGVTTATFDAFVSDVVRQGSVPIIVLLPHPGDIARQRKTGTRRYAPLVEHLRAKGYRYVDVLDWLAAHARNTAVRDLAPTHYSPLGNILVAEAVWNYLVTQRLIDRPVSK